MDELSLTKWLWWLLKVGFFIWVGLCSLLTTIKFLWSCSWFNLFCMALWIPVRSLARSCMSGCTRALRRRSQQTECAEELRSDDQVLYRNQLQTRNQTSRVEDELTSRPNSTETMDIPLRTLPTLSSVEFINAIQQRTTGAPIAAVRNSETGSAADPTFRASFAASAFQSEVSSALMSHQRTTGAPSTARRNDEVDSVADPTFRASLQPALSTFSVHQVRHCAIRNLVGGRPTFGASFAASAFQSEFSSALMSSEEATNVLSTAVCNSEADVVVDPTFGASFAASAIQTEVSIH
uniref:Transmembrane protein n=1 Tax=Ditylenchus dipsaci TaxID=166011 RepID=A0A915D6X4_9BILA